MQQRPFSKPRRVRHRGNPTTTFWAVALTTSLLLAVIVSGEVAGEAPILDHPGGAWTLGVSMVAFLSGFWALKTAFSNWMSRRRPERES